MIFRFSNFTRLKKITSGLSINSRLKVALVCLSLGVLSTGCKTDDKSDSLALIVKANAALEQDRREDAKTFFEQAIQFNKQSSEALFGLSQILAAENNWSPMVRNLNTLLNINEDHFEGRLLLAHYYMGAKNLDEAQKHVNYLRVLQPNNREVLLMQAAIHMQHNKPNETLSAIGDLLENNPADAEVLYLLALHHNKQKNFPDALNSINETLKLDASNFDYNMFKVEILKSLGRNEDAAVVYQYLMAEYPSKTELAIALARFYVENGSIDKAVEVFEHFAKTNDQPAFYGRAIELIMPTQGAKTAEKKLQSYLAQAPSMDLKLVLADLYAQTGRVKLADETLLAIASSQNTIAQKIEIFSRRARYAMIENDWDSARSFMNEGLSLSPTDNNLLAIKGALYLSQGEAKKAIALLAPIAETSSSIEILMTLAAAYEADTQWAAAERHYEKAIRQPNVNSYQLTRYSEYLIQINQFQKAKKVLLPMIRAGSKDPKVLSLYTRISLANKKWSDALKTIQQLEQQVGQTKETLQFSALAYVGKNDKNPAYDSLKKLYALAPGDASVLSFVVQSFVKFKDEKAAEKFLEAAIARKENPYVANLLLGQLAQGAKQWEKAEAAYKKALSTNQTWPEAYKSLVGLYLGLGRMEDAESTLHLAISTVANNTGFRLKLASIYTANQKIQQAVTLYQTILAEDNNTDIAANNLAMIYMEFGDTESLEKAEILASRFSQSDVPEFLDTLAWIYVAQGKNSEAASLLFKAAQINPNNPSIQYHLGVTYFNTNRLPRAEESILKALNLINDVEAPSWKGDAEALLHDIRKAKQQSQ